MSKKLTTYQQPSILHRISTAPNIEVLKLLRELIGIQIKLGKISPKGRTIDKWVEALWSRIVHLMKEEKDPSRLCYIKNLTDAWPRSAKHEELVNRIFQHHVKLLPSPREILEAKGIIIEGVTNVG